MARTQQAFLCSSSQLRLESGSQGDNGAGGLSVVKTFNKYFFIVFGFVPTMVSANPVLSTWFSLLLLERDMLERGPLNQGQAGV